MALKKKLESPLDCKEIKSINPKEINPEYSCHLMQTADKLEKTLMLGKTESKRRRGQQGIRRLESITDSLYMDLSFLKIMKDREAWYAVVHEVTKS